MKEAVLLAVLAVLLAAGYFLMKKVDLFADENFPDCEDEKINPSCVVLTEELSDEEVVAEIQRFRNSHGKADIFISCRQTDLGDEKDSSGNK